jgi:hypothetical protein
MKHGHCSVAASVFGLRMIVTGPSGSSSFTESNTYFPDERSKFSSSSSSSDCVLFVADCGSKHKRLKLLIKFEITMVLLTVYLEREDYTRPVGTKAT